MVLDIHTPAGTFTTVPANNARPIMVDMSYHRNGEGTLVLYPHDVTDIESATTASVLAQAVMAQLNRVVEYVRFGVPTRTGVAAYHVSKRGAVIGVCRAGV